MVLPLFGMHKKEAEIVKHVRQSFLNLQFMVYYTPYRGRRRLEAHSGAGEQFKAAGKKEVDGVHPVYESGKGKQASF